MNILDLIIQAIRLKKPISFEYNRPGKTPGIRTGNPHVLFNQHYKDQNKGSTIKLDMWQTSGVSDSKIQKPLPDWRLFFIGGISNIEIHHNEPNFTPAEGYKPESDRYNDDIEKI